MTAILIDFTTRRPVPASSEPRLQPKAGPLFAEQVKRRARWERQRLIMRAAMFERCAINARLYLTTEGSREHERLRAAYCIAREAWALSWKELLRTPAPNATALAWKKLNDDRSPEVAATFRGETGISE